MPEEILTQEDYANVMDLSWTMSDVRIGLGLLTHPPAGRVQTNLGGVIIPWSQAKLLAIEMTKIVARFEELNGELKPITLGIMAGGRVAGEDNPNVDPIHIKRRPWLVESHPDNPVANGVPLQGCKIREIKPITQEQITAALLPAHGVFFERVNYVNFLRNLGIDVED